MNTNREDVYTRVTNQIVKAIEEGVTRCRMPWHITGADCFCPINALSKRPYRGINVLTLWIAAVVKGYENGIWGTYNQWKEQGAQVRKGEQATTVVLWKPTEQVAKASEAEETTDEGQRHRGLLAKGFSVFNVAQVDGYQQPIRPELPEGARIRAAEQVFFGVGATIEHSGAQAFYDIEADCIRLPRFATFRDAVGYYATLAHELTHYAACRIMPCAI